MRLLLDTNVLLDVLAAREPWAHNAAALLSLVEGRHAEGFVAAHAITTLHYLLSKSRGRETAAAALVDLLAIVRVVAVDHETVTRALALGWADFEDAVHAVCAMDSAADFLVTRDPAHFRDSPVPIASPAEALALLNAPD